MNAERFEDHRKHYTDIKAGEWGDLGPFNTNLVDRIGELLDEVERLAAKIEKIRDEYRKYGCTS